MAVELGAGYVDLAVRYGDAQKQVARMFADVQKRAAQAGTAAGRDLNRGLASANVGQGLGTQIQRNMGDGSAVGRQYGARVAAGLSSAVASAGRSIGAALATTLQASATIAGTGLAAGLTSALSLGFKRLTAIDDATFKLKALGNSAADVQAIMDNALKAVQGTAFGLDEAATTAASAVAAGIKPGEQLTSYLTLTADTAAIAGTSLAEMGSIFNKVQTSGKAFTADLNMLSDRGLPIFQWLQEEYGVTGEALADMVAAGEVDAETFRKVIQENIGGAAQTMGESVRGTLANLKASFSRFGAELAKPLFAALLPLGAAFTQAFDGITKALKPYMEQLSATVGVWAEQFGAKVTAWVEGGGVERVIAFVQQLVASISSLSSGEGGASVLSSMSAAFAQIGPALQQAGPAMGAFGQALVAAGPETIAAVLAPALNMLAGTLKFLADNASWAVPVLGGLALAMGGLTLAAKTIGPAFNAFNAVMNALRTPLILAQNRAITAQSIAMDNLSRALGVNAVAQEAQAAASGTNTAATATNTVATNTNAAAQSRGRLATLASAAALKIKALAVRAVTAAQWLWNAALTANPIGIVVVAVAALGAALWAFFTKTEVGRELWDKIWNGIKATATTVWEWLKNTLGKVWQDLQPGLQQLKAVASEAFSAIGNAVKKVWEFIQPAIIWVGKLWLAFQKLQFQAIIAAFKLVGEVIGWLWRNVAVPAFTHIANAIQLWWAGAKVVFAAVKPVIQTIGDIFLWLWRNAIVPAWDGIKAAFSAAWTVAQNIFGAFKTAISVLGAVFRAVFNDFVMPIWRNLQTVIGAAWTVIQPIWESMKAGFEAVGDIFSTVWSSVLEPAWELIKSGFQAGWDAVSAVLETMKTGFTAVKDFISGVWNGLAGIVESALDAVVDAIKAPLRAMGSLILTILPDSSSIAGIEIPGYNTAKSLGQTLQGLAAGGLVRGPGTGTSDSILAWLSNGEGVVTARAMNAGGSHLVAALNAGWVPSPEFLRGMLPEFAEGLNPGADFLRSTIMRMWPQITSIGGRRSEDGLGEHSTGNAIDVMIPNYTTPEGKALGDAIASFVVANKDALGLDGMIWRQMSFGYGNSWAQGKEMPDRGSDTQNHLDHLHIILGKGRGAGAPEVGVPSVRLSMPSGSASSPSTSLTTGSTGTSQQVREAQDRITNLENDLTVAQQSLSEAEANPDTKESTLQNKRNRVDELTRDLEQAKSDLSSLESQASSTTSSIGSDPFSKIFDGFGELADLAKSGVMETLLPEGFSNPFDWGVPKAAAGVMNFISGLVQDPFAKGALNIGAGILTGDASGVVSSIQGMIPQPFGTLDPAQTSLAPEDFMAYQAAPGVSMATPDLAAATPAGGTQGQGGTGTNVDQRIQFNGNVGADPQQVQTHIASSQNMQFRQKFGTARK